MSSSCLFNSGIINSECLLLLNLVQILDIHVPRYHLTCQSLTYFILFQISLGILEKDENFTQQMIDIIAHLQQYVPKTDSDKMIPILLGGDALSGERGEATERARLDAITPEDSLDGFLWKSEDWHGHVISLQVYLKSFMKIIYSASLKNNTYFITGYCINKFLFC